MVPKVRWTALPLALGGALLAGFSCPKPVVRTGLLFDGSAYWAWQLAQPKVAAFGSDAVLYSVLGAQVWHDGRLPSNTGDWSFVTWSRSLRKEFQVTVLFDGTLTTSTRDRPGAPGVAGQPVPSGWVNSPQVFQAAEQGRHSGDDVATVVVFNWSTASSPGLWGISYPSGILAVRWDGTYVGAY